MNPIGLLSAAGSFLLPWLLQLSPSFPVISTWMVSGAVLLLIGWVSLSAASDPRVRAGPAPGAAASAARVALGATLGIAAAWAGAWLIRVATDPGLPAFDALPVPTGGSLPLFLPLGVLGGIAGGLSTSSRWTGAGIAAWLGHAVLSLGFVGYGSLVVREGNGAFAVLLGGMLLLLETFGLCLMLAYQFYALEHVTGRDQPQPPSVVSVPEEQLPVVAIQVASYNEPVGVVKDSLESVLALDYPTDRRIIQLLDDSTDPATHEELARFCAGRGIEFRHRPERRGFKAGALNDGLAVLPPNVELLAIIDSDYTVAPEFLRNVVGHFRDPSVAFVQTPQAYRNASASPFARGYALADAYFYHVVQPVRARQQSAIFCGTMGLVRRRALEAAGGWAENCVTEDAELSVRLLSQGGRMVYDPRTYGRGLAPLSMEGVRSQHRRWAYGGIQLLRMNRHRLRSSQVTARQRRDFWVGGMFWTDGIFFLGMAAALASLAVGSWFGWALPSPAATALTFAAAAPVLLLWDGLLKIRLALGRTHRVRYGDVLGVMGFWYAVKVNDLGGALRGLTGGRLPFVRTPKVSQPRPSRWQAFRAAVSATAWETTLSLSLLTVVGVSLWRWMVSDTALEVVAAASLSGWLLFYAWALAASPYTDYVSRRRPAELPISAQGTWTTPAPLGATPSR